MAIYGRMTICCFVVFFYPTKHSRRHGNKEMHRERLCTASLIMRPTCRYKLPPNVVRSPYRMHHVVRSPYRKHHVVRSPYRMHETNMYMI